MSIISGCAVLIVVNQMLKSAFFFEVRSASRGTETIHGHRCCGVIGARQQTSNRNVGINISRTYSVTENSRRQRRALCDCSSSSSSDSAVDTAFKAKAYRRDAMTDSLQLVITDSRYFDVIALSSLLHAVICRPSNSFKVCTSAD